MFRLGVGGYITSWDVKQYEYCPTIPWIRANHLVEEPATPSMTMGRLSLEEKEAVARELGLPRPVRFEVPVASRRLGAAGVVDVVAGSRRLTVVEVKRFYRRSYRHFETQLKFYAYLVSYEIAPVHRAVLKLGDRVVEYAVEAEDLRRVEELVGRVRGVVESPSPPPANTDPARCSMCWYRRYCPYH